MKKLGVMPEDGIINNCDLHGLNLPLKEGLEDALGITGIGHNSPWQLLYVSNLLLDHLVEIYGNDKMHLIWSEINEKIMNNPRFQTEGTRLGGLCFSDYYEAIQEKSNTNPDDVMEQLNKSTHKQARSSLYSMVDSADLQ
jgi:hypothetical protein